MTVTADGGQPAVVVSEGYVSHARYHEVLEQLERAEAEVRALRADREIMGRELLGEAETRQWCDEYNGFVDRVNGLLSTPWLKHYFREIDITYRVRIRGKARNSDDAYNEIYSCLQGIEIDSDNGEITDIDVQA